MSTEELLKPRYKVLARYPDSPLRIGQVINGETFNVAGGTKFHCQDYPAIFRKMDWEEEREIQEMPKYVKDEKRVLRVLPPERNGTIYHQPLTLEIRFLYPVNRHGYLPATKDEYDAFIKTV